MIKEATCTEAGTKYRTCKHNSIHIEMASIEATGHDIKHFDAVEATCKDAGNIEYWYCGNCGKYFSDAEGTTEITQADTLIPVDKTKHVWDDGTVTTPASFAGDGVMTYTCTVCGETRTEAIPKKEKKAEPAPTPTPTPTPAPTPAPDPSPKPEPSGGSDLPLPLYIVGGVGLVAVGALVGVLISRRKGE